MTDHAAPTLALSFADPAHAGLASALVALGLTVARGRVDLEPLATVTVLAWLERADGQANERVVTGLFRELAVQALMADIEVRESSNSDATGTP